MQIRFPGRRGGAHLPLLPVARSGMPPHPDVGQPLHVSGHCFAPYCLHRAQCDACGLFGHTRMTLKLVSTRRRVSSTGQFVVVHKAPALTQAVFACCLMSEADVRLLLNTLYSGGQVVCRFHSSCFFLYFPANALLGADSASSRRQHARYAAQMTGDKVQGHAS